MAHELVKAYHRKNISTRCMLKFDLQKAYDSVEWPYLEQVMQELGFTYLFIQWVMACVKTVTYKIVVNGVKTHPFEAAKGLRQDDLLIFSRCDLSSITAIQRCFTKFSLVSRLQVNLSKSSIYCRGVTNSTK